VDDIKFSLGDIRWGSVGWTDLAEAKGRWRAVVNTVMNLPTTSVKYREILELLQIWQPLEKVSAPWS
jgi:hypothetical protein